MIPSLRTAFNKNFTTAKYEALLKDIALLYDYTPTFRICETPVFFSEAFTEKVFSACEHIIDVLCRPDFKNMSQPALEINGSSGNSVPNEDAHPTFLVIDFGVCAENNELVPKLIELQGFPSLYFFQPDLAKVYQKIFELPETLTPFFNGLNEKTYIETMRRVIVGDTPPEQVILLEIEPEKQNTRIDFLATENHLGIETVCLTKIRKRGKNLYYTNKNGKNTRIKKIYNRVIFDELTRRTDLKPKFQFTDDLNVEWIGHPNWFFRISKHTLPFFNSPYIPKTFFLNEVDTSALDLKNYVLKPLFSFSGQGVKIDVTPEDIAGVQNPSNYILQEKVNYADVLETPSGPAKVEWRLMFVWEKNAPRPVLVTNLVRVSKGIMIGVRYNKDKDWVGGSIGLING